MRPKDRAPKTTIAELGSEELSLWKAQPPPSSLPSVVGVVGPPLPPLFFPA